MKKILMSVLIVLVMASVALAEEGSGFLGDWRSYNLLQKNPEFKNIRDYRYPGARVSDYNKFLIRPVKIYLSPESEAEKRDISDEEMSRLARFFREEIVDTLSDKYAVVHSAGPDVLELRFAITDAWPNRALLNIHPGSTLMGKGRGGASIEIEVLDSHSQERLGIAMASQRGKARKITKGMGRWAHTEGVLSDWAKDIRKYIDDAHSRRK